MLSTLSSSSPKGQKESLHSSAGYYTLAKMPWVSDLIQPVQVDPWQPIFRVDLLSHVSGQSLHPNPTALQLWVSVESFSQQLDGTVCKSAVLELHLRLGRQWLRRWSGSSTDQKVDGFIPSSDVAVAHVCAHHRGVEGNCREIFFWERWNFPLCSGALDVVLKAPANSGSRRGASWLVRWSLCQV